MDYQVSMAIELLRLGYYVQSTLDRLYIVLIANYVMVKVSLELI